MKKSFLFNSEFSVFPDFIRVFASLANLIFLILVRNLCIFRVFISWLRSQNPSFSDAEVDDELDTNFPEWFKSYVSSVFICFIRSTVYFYLEVLN